MHSKCDCKYKCKMGIKIVNKCLAADCDNIMVMWTIGVELRNQGDL